MMPSARLTRFFSAGPVRAWCSAAPGALTRRRAPLFAGLAVQAAISLMVAMPAAAQSFDEPNPRATTAADAAEGLAQKPLLTGAGRIAAAPDSSRGALADPSVWRKAIPNCKKFEVDSDGGFTARGPLDGGILASEYKLKLRFIDSGTPDVTLLAYELKAGMLGDGEGFMRLSLSEQDGETLVDYQMSGRFRGLYAKSLKDYLRENGEAWMVGLMKESAAGAVPRPALLRQPARQPGL